MITALALVRSKPGAQPRAGHRHPPFAVSPVVVGVSLILLWGAGGWFGGLESLGFKVIFSLPGMVIATIVTLPFVVREVEPVLHEIGDDQEQAAATLGASRWQTFWRITLPAIRWGLTYGVVLTVARALGEFEGKNEGPRPCTPRRCRRWTWSALPHQRHPLHNLRALPPAATICWLFFLDTFIRQGPTITVTNGAHPHPAADVSIDGLHPPS